MGFIYVRTNTVNGKQYVGQTVDTKRRNRDWNNLNWKYGGELIENARVKYTPAAFSFDILKECPDEDMDKWEAYFIDMLNTKIPNGYNLTDGGGGNQGYTWSDNARKRQSQKYQGRKLTDEWKEHISEGQRGEKNWNFGGHLSDEQKEKISRAHMGKHLSEEHKKKISKTLKGKPKSPEASAKSGLSRRGRIVSSETRQKLSNAFKGKYNTKKSKPVLASDDEGNIIYKFPSTAEAERNGFNHRNIVACCNGERKTHRGLHWQYI